MDTKLTEEEMLTTFGILPHKFFTMDPAKQKAVVESLKPEQAYELGQLVGRCHVHHRYATVIDRIDAEVMATLIKGDCLTILGMHRIGEKP